MIITQEKNIIHFQTLDLLRGVAAICVVLYHFSSRVAYGGILDHGYLAVDFFFCLSGYVIFQAYEDKILYNEISVQKFFIIRSVRFLPMVVFGNIIAAIADLYRPGNYNEITHVFDIAVSFVLSCLLLPTLYKTTLEQTTYPLNGPVWSLFFEMIANIIFALVVRIRFFWGISAGICLSSFAALTYISFIKGDIHVGPHIEFFLYAFPRVFFSFFAGILLHRIKLKITIMSWWISCTIIVFVFFVPEIHNAIANSIFDLTSIAVIFPFIVYSGANYSHFELGRLSRRFGDLSYPLYTVHYPLVRVFSVFIRQRNLSTFFNFFLSLAITSIFSIISLLIYRLYDKPVRNKISTWLQLKAGNF